MPGVRYGGNRKRLLTGDKLLAIRWIRSEDLMHNTMTIVNNTRSCNWNLLGVEFKGSHKKVNMWGDRGVY